MIRLYYGDHSPPHFHAFYGGEEALFDIRTLALLSGRLPARAMGLVAEWASLHRAELSEAWRRAQQGQEPGSIEPLS